MDQKLDTAPPAAMKLNSAVKATGPTPGWVERGLARTGYTLSPVNKRRLERFKSHKLGYRSFLIFMALFLVTLFAEFIANDRPLIAYYKGELLSPVLVDYPEEKFGGFLADTDYRAPVIQDEINANGWMIWPLIRYSYDTINKDYPGRVGADAVCLGYPAPPPWSSSLP